MARSSWAKSAGPTPAYAHRGADNVPQNIRMRLWPEQSVEMVSFRAAARMLAGRPAPKLCSAGRTRNATPAAGRKVCIARTKVAPGWFSGPEVKAGLDRLAGRARLA